MNFIKQQSIGFYLTVLAVIAAAVGLAFCFINHGTSTFGNIALSPVTVAGGIVAIVLGLVVVVGGQFGTGNAVMRAVVDLSFVIAAVLLVVAAVSFVADRVNTIASVLSFTQNAQSMADLQSVIYGGAGLLVAAVLTVLASYFKVRKAK